MHLVSASQIASRNDDTCMAKLLRIQSAPAAPAQQQDGLAACQASTVHQSKAKSTQTPVLWETQRYIWS